MQPHGRRTWTPVEAEGEGALARVADVILGISDVEDAGLGRAVFQLQEDGARRRGVLNLLSADFQGVLGLDDFFFRSRRLFFFFWLFRGFFRRWRWLLLGEAEIRSKENQRDGAQKAKRTLHG